MASPRMSERVSRPGVLPLLSFMGVFPLLSSMGLLPLLPSRRRVAPRLQYGLKSNSIWRLIARSAAWIFSSAMSWVRLITEIIMFLLRFPDSGRTPFAGRRESGVAGAVDHLRRTEAPVAVVVKYNSVQSAAPRTSFWRPRPAQIRSILIHLFARCEGAT